MPFLVLVAAVATMLGITLLVYGLMPARSETRKLVASNLQRGDAVDLRELALKAPARERALPPLLNVVASLGRRVTSSASIAGLERKFVLAGRPSTWTLERLLAAKIMCGVVGALVVFTEVTAGAGARSLVLALAFAVLCYFAPDVFISARASERQRRILHELPDALDQMTICMEAGLGFDAAMARTSRSSTSPLGHELVRTLQEIQVGIGRKQALSALADRNHVPDLRHFVTALLQAESYGVPIVKVLRDQAGELRTKRRQRAEEAARKLPLKMLIPLVLFILPPLFIVLIGPAAIELSGAFSGFGG